MQELIRDLEAKEARGVKQVRVTTVLTALKTSTTSTNGENPEPEQTPRQKRAAMNRLLLDGVVPDLVGSAEVSEILGVGKPQIAKWLNPGDGQEPRMPKPILRTAAGPLWPRVVIEKFKPEADDRKRRRAGEAEGGD